MSDSCNPMDCSPPGSFVRGISQAGILEWVAISVSKGSSRPRDWTCFSCFFTTEPLASLGSISYFPSSLSFALDSVSIPDPIHYCLNFFNFISWYQIRWVSSLFYLSSVLTIFGLHTLFFNQWDTVIAIILFFWPHCVAGRTLVLQPGIKPIPNAVKVQGPNHWTAKELLPTNFRISLSNSM